MTTATYMIPADTLGFFTPSAAESALGKEMNISMHGGVVARGRVVAANADENGNLTLEVESLPVLPDEDQATHLGPLDLGHFSIGYRPNSPVRETPRPVPPRHPSRVSGKGRGNQRRKE